MFSKHPQNKTKLHYSTTPLRSQRGWAERRQQWRKGGSDRGRSQRATTTTMNMTTTRTRTAMTTTATSLDGNYYPDGGYGFASDMGEKPARGTASTSTQQADAQHSL